MTACRDTETTPAHKASAAEGFVDFAGQPMYRIDASRLSPFLMTLVSDTDLWMYVSSTGGLTAGRVSEDGAIFPYDTDDKLHQLAGISGPATLLRVRLADGSTCLWEPFAPHASRAGLARHLYKDALGTRIIFEESRPDLQLVFRYQWATSDAYGFVRSATLENHSSSPVEVELLDGLVNLLPSGADLTVQRQYSCLLNAYTQCEVDPATRLGIIAMSCHMVDRPEPAEALRATVAWCAGLPAFDVLLSAAAVDAFRQELPLSPAPRQTGRRGAYLVHTHLHLAAHTHADWDIVVDAQRDQFQVEAIRQKLTDPAALRQDLRRSIDTSRENLTRAVASADGLQFSSDRMVAAHHQANTLFNILRGGIFQQNYDVPSADFAEFLAARNHAVSAAHAAWLATLPAQLTHQDLLDRAGAADDPDLLRLCHEYLPLTFGRRHGDPSRPWNRFAIRVKGADGNPLLSYQGNWRDIFQNWEALATSFPQFLPSLIAKFVNASTPDGFNPYRVTREGIDWETAEEGNPWSHIGYWGDHQIIYLLKFLEALDQHAPARLAELLTQPLFVYANVPYRLRSYQQIVDNRWSTIDYDHPLAAAIAKRVTQLGEDGKLLAGADGAGAGDGAGGIWHVNLAEKLLVPALAKLSNLLVDGGIWMNTQRPEWNDANNALVGNGVSMVTHCYLRRYVVFCIDLFSRAHAGAGASANQSIALSAELAQWLDRVHDILAAHLSALEAPSITDTLRKEILDALGQAFSDYRQQVYSSGFSTPVTRQPANIIAMLKTALAFLDHGIRANRRDDGLYHSYNLIEFSADHACVSVGRLYEMLEGQVAVLSSGLLTASEAAGVLKALFASAMYRPDQDSFILYPARRLSDYLQKNLVPADQVQSSPLLRQLVDTGDTSILSRDVAGQYRFNCNFRKSADLADAIKAIAANPRWTQLAADHTPAALATFETVFHHSSFTGRSGAMYGYEGLGSIYWHMVAKLLLAVQECIQQAMARHESPDLIRQLAGDYHRIRAGLGFNKTAAVYGAFPADPYSHTPAHAGAQQPGMTGQVKEEILTRQGELGIRIDRGQITFAPTLLRAGEFTTSPQTFNYFAPDGQPRALQLPAQSLAFTLCQTPIIYRLTDGASSTTITLATGQQLTRPSTTLDPQLSQSIFARTGQLASLEVQIPRQHLLPTP